MARALIALAFLAAAPQVSAQEHSALTETQQVGKRLYEQSCGVCHTRPTLVSGLYGPPLSRESAGGRADVMREVIANGTPRMPGFKYTYSPDQIAAIAGYLETVAGPEAAPAPAVPQRLPVQDR